MLLLNLFSMFSLKTIYIQFFFFFNLQVPENLLFLSWSLGYLESSQLPIIFPSLKSHELRTGKGVREGGLENHFHSSEKRVRSFRCLTMTGSSARDSNLGGRNHSVNLSGHSHFSLH